MLHLGLHLPAVAHPAATCGAGRACAVRPKLCGAARDGPAARRCCVLAGLIEVDEHGKLFNTYVAVTPEAGVIARHRKLHAFVNPHLSSGDAYTVFDLLGCKCGILICYDNNLPENPRLTALLGASIIFAPHVTGCSASAMPGRGLVDPSLWARRAEDPVPLRLELNGPKGRGWLMRWLPARAWENGVYVIFTNPIGLDGGEVRNGNAMVLDPYGEVLSECHALGADVCVAMCTESKLGLAGGRRYLRARRPDLYWPLTEGDAGATLPGWQRQAPADISEQAEEAAGAMPSRLGDPRVLRAAQVLYDFMRMKASARSVHQARASRSPRHCRPHPPARIRLLSIPGEPASRHHVLLLHLCCSPPTIGARMLRVPPCAAQDEPPLAPADAILVLGSNDIRVAHCAAALYARGLAPRVVFSGKQGRATEWLGERTEASWLAEAAEAKGLPRATILEEPNATNTGENIRYCRELLAGQTAGGHAAVDGQRYIVVQKPFMLRRSWATFVRQWPGPSFQLACPEFAELPDYVDESIGMSLDVIIHNMVGDAQRLLFYSEVKDFQAPVEVPGRVWAAVGLLVGFGYTQTLCQR